MAQDLYAELRVMIETAHNQLDMGRPEPPEYLAEFLLKKVTALALVDIAKSLDFICNHPTDVVINNAHNVGKLEY